MNPLIILALQVPCVLFATTLHEFTRAVVSTCLGDKCPKEEGRLTINPFRHFEPIGFILALLTGFGWARPVKTSALYYKDRKIGIFLCAVVPTAANIAAAAAVSAFVKFYGDTGLVLGVFLFNLMRINVSIAVYNILPITPMDGLKVMSVVIPSNTYFRYIQYEKIIQMIFLLLLFMGYTDFIFETVISIIMAILV